MVVLGGLKFLMSEVPLYTALRDIRFRAKRERLKHFEDFHLKAKARICP